MIDAKDERILEELIEDGRKSVVETSNEPRIPRATVLAFFGKGRLEFAY